MSRRNLGIVIAAAGGLVALVAATADVIGLSATGSDNAFGNRQIIGVVAGAVAVFAGLIVLKPRTVGPRFPVESAAIVAVFLGTLGFSLWAASRGWDNPILEMHRFRQTQTAISVYHILHGSSWLAYETPVLGPPWSIPFEFPLFQWIVALIVKGLNTPLDETGRFTSLSFFYLSLVPAYALLGLLGIRKLHRLVFLALFLASPLYLFWSRSFMIESTALFLGLTYAASGAAYLATRRTLFAMLATTAGILAAMVKAPTFFGFSLIAGALLLRFWANRDRTESGISPVRLFAIYVLLLAVIPVLCLVAWTQYSDGLKSLNPLGEHLTSTNLARWNYGTFDQRLSSELWIDSIYERMFPDILGSSWVIWALLLFFVFAVCRAFPRRINLLVSMLVFLAVLLAFPNLHMVHNYYQYANGIFLIASVGFALEGQLELGRANRIGAIALLVVLVWLGVGRYSATYLPIQSSNTTSELDLHASALAANQLTQPDDVLVVFGDDWDSTVPYYSERKALMEPGWMGWETPAFQAALANLKSAQIGAVLVCRNARSDREDVQERLSALGFRETASFQNEACEIYLPASRVMAP